jgi:hypothetical protein
VNRGVHSRLFRRRTGKRGNSLALLRLNILIATPDGRNRLMQMLLRRHESDERSELRRERNGRIELISEWEELHLGTPSPDPWDLSL